MEVYIWDWSEEDPLQLVHTQVMTNKECKDALGLFPLLSQSITHGPMSGTSVNILARQMTMKMKTPWMGLKDTTTLTPETTR